MFNEFKNVPNFLKAQSFEMSFEKPNYAVINDPASYARKWLLIGAFQQIKSVFVFTNEA